jgi:hypothetical protein
MRTNLAVIPGGLTSVIQPRDLSVKNPFKDNVIKLYTQRMAEGGDDVSWQDRKPFI